MKKRFIACLLLCLMLNGTAYAWTDYFKIDFDEAAGFFSNIFKDDKKENVSRDVKAENSSETLPPEIASEWDSLTSNLTDALELRGSSVGSRPVAEDGDAAHEPGGFQEPLFLPPHRVFG